MKTVLTIILTITITAISFAGLPAIAAEGSPICAESLKECDKNAFAEFMEFCKVNECRKNTEFKLKKKDGSYFEFSREISPPAVRPSFISILPGETLFVEADLEGDRLINLKRVKTIDHPEKTIRLSFWQEPKIGDGTGMMLKVLNPFEKYLRYRIDMMLLDSESMYYTSSCPVIPGKLSYEHWPHPIFQLFLTDLKLVEIKGDKVVCE